MPEDQHPAPQPGDGRVGEHLIEAMSARWDAQFGPARVTLSELYTEIARRDQRITELTAALTGLIDTYDQGVWRGKTNWDAAWATARNALGWPQPDPDLDPAELRITFYDPPDATCIDSPGRGVSILHVPSGWGSSCHTERSQLQNKARALDALRARVATWRNTE